jgi:hypothetical protein
MRRRPYISLLAVAAAAVLAIAAPAARADFLPGDVIDAAPGLVGVYGADLAEDGTGGVAYLRSDGGVNHLFVSRVVNGVFQPGERVDVGVPEPASSANIVAAEEGRLIVAWNAGGRLMVATRASVDAGWSAPAPLYDGRGGGRTVTNVSLDAGIYAVPYIAFTTTGAGGADVRSARMVGGDWTIDPAPLDANPFVNAGDGLLKRPDVAANAEGSAFAVWGEDGADGITHVYGRRITRNGVASTVREISVTSLEGRGSLGADSAEMAMKYDSSYGWVTFRQVFNDGGVPRSRALVRRLVASDFGPPAATDGLAFGGAEGAGTPRLDIDGRGRGLATSVRDGSSQVFGALVRPGQPSEDLVAQDALQPVARLDSLTNYGPASAVPAAAENGRAALAWQQIAAPGAPGEILARAFDNDTFTATKVVSRPELGSATAARGLAVAADRPGDTVVAFMQGGDADRKLVAAVDDQPPTRPRLETTTGWIRSGKPTISWTEADDPWSAKPLYQVQLGGGLVIGQTAGLSLAPANPIPDGTYVVRVVALDRRLQGTASTDRKLRLDTTPPTARFTVRRRRLVLKITDLTPVRVGASREKGSGILKVKIAFGDKRTYSKRARRPLSSLSVSHAFPRAGRYRVTTRLADDAGNVGKVTTRVRVR